MSINVPRDKVIGKGTPLKDTFIKIGFKKLTDFLRVCDDVIEVQDNDCSAVCFPRFSTTSADIQLDYKERMKELEGLELEGTERMKDISDRSIGIRCVSATEGPQNGQHLLVES